MFTVRAAYLCLSFVMIIVEECFFVMANFTNRTNVHAAFVGLLVHGIKVTKKFGKQHAADFNFKDVVGVSLL